MSNRPRSIALQPGRPVRSMMAISSASESAAAPCLDSRSRGRSSSGSSWMVREAISRRALVALAENVLDHLLRQLVPAEKREAFPADDPLRIDDDAVRNARDLQLLLHTCLLIDRAGVFDFRIGELLDRGLGFVGDADHDELVPELFLKGIQ